jgi:type I restriction enzyme S subunit
MDYELGDIIHGTIDYRGKTPKRFDSGIPVLSAANVKKGKIKIDDKFISKEYYDKWTTRGFIKPGDILITTEAPVGEIAKVPGDQIYMISRRVFALQVNEDLADETYIYYLLLTEGVLKYFESISHGATAPRIYKDEVLKLKIDLPDTDTQKKIAAILSSYDDLIENNNQRIKLLEGMSTEIYKEWFVRFRFPGYKEATFLDKEGNKVAHGTKGAIPEGWENEQVGNVIATIKRKPKVKKDFYQEQGTIPVIDQGNNLIVGYVEDEKYLQSEPLPLLVFGDHTRRLKFVDYPFASGADGTQLLYPKNRALLPTYFYLSIKQIDLSNFHYARHFKFLKKESILIPDDITLSKFNELTSPFLKEIDLLRNKNQLLQETRDLLLPRLISGKLSVEHLEVEEK